MTAQDQPGNYECPDCGEQLDTMASAVGHRCAQERPPCECGSKDARWHGNRNGHRYYQCDACAFSHTRGGGEAGVPNERD